ncbi:hypothetical protein BC749_102481 [Flavobacterium araucananum]|uniref:Uncharacterized protein n=1 Tax=Flavobacterium araucananum TaxID=946678 RepID=A0A227PBB6_9FLAO|nr:hypothetical protein [Flavobacterium araucananum]OXG06568.1 hypothetical protein B0A64_10690 [Flavobacterium araucananum]PWK00913.1 hypothetical protein BC749_102481 [Flavobacterium araucananum]
MNIKIIILLAVIIILLLNYKRILSYIKYIKEQKAIEFKKRTNLNLDDLYKLSAPSTFLLFGFENNIFQKPVLYFDENNLYCITSNLPVVQHPLSSITEVQRTAVMINKRRVWKIIIKDNNIQKAYKFRVYRNLDLFLEKVKENPNSIVDDRYIWGIFE